MKHQGWPYEFKPKPWDEIHSFLSGMAAQDSQFQYLVDVVQSVIDSGSVGDLAATTSMHDLVVVAFPVPEPPFGVVIVRAPGSIANPPLGNVIIEHISGVGRDDKIQRPAAETVALFWRFMIEKFGVSAR
ncbi:MAG: hypothetical protein ABIN55_12460 [Aeromicrobium sp.]